MILQKFKKTLYEKLFILFLLGAFSLSSIAHIIRGYYFLGMTVDPASHLGFINSVIKLGEINSYDLFYPGMHIFSTIFYFFSNIDFRVFFITFPFLLSLLSLAGIYLFYREIIDSHETLNIAFLISCALLNGSIILLTPNLFANAFIPIIFYLIIKIHKKQNLSLNLLCVIFYMFIIISYLLSVIAIIVFLLMIWIFFFLQKNYRIGQHDCLKHFFTNHILFHFLLIIICLIFWLSFFRPWRTLVYNLKYILEGDLPLTHITTTIEKMDYASDFGYNLIEIIFRLYGPTILVLILITISFLVILKKRSQNNNEKIFLSLYGPIIGYISLSGVLFLFNFNFGPLRFIPYINFIAPVAIAWLFVFWLNSKSFLFSKNQKFFLILFLLAGLFLSCLLINYHSPYNFHPNYQDTKEELFGAKWFLQTRDLKYPISGVTFSPGRYEKALQSEIKREYTNLPNYLSSNINYSFAANPEKATTAFQAPYHFGYQQGYDTIARFYHSKTYLIILERDIIYYKEQFTKLAKYRWLTSDFYHLKDDNQINLIYSNNGFDVWIINKK
jgi:hypothetical protein